MTENTDRTFFALLKAGLWEQKVETQDFGNIDYAQILQYATEQSVVGMIAAGIEHVVDVKVPQVWVLQFIGSTLQLEQRNQAMNSFVADLIQDMRQHGIYVLLVKGQGTAQCYERPLWRTCGDVDLFLSEENYGKAKEFLMPLGEITEPEEKAKRHSAIKVREWMVELHGTLHVGLSKRVDCVLDDVQIDTFNGGSVRSWANGRVQIFQLSIENDVFYTFTHILQHFYKGGIGLRQICDWCRLMWKNKDKLNFAKLESLIRKAGLMTEWRTFYNLAYRYLGLPNLGEGFMAHDPRFDKKADRVMAFVMEVGNFGHNRDTGYLEGSAYLKRKTISASRRIKDLLRHTSIFPVNSVKFFFGIMWNGVVSTVRGE